MPQTYVVRLGCAGSAFPARAERTLLQSALDAGLTLPASCRNGTCRTCMQQLAAGKVAYRIEWPGLLADEKLQGWILPCVAYPQSDLELRDTHVTALNGAP